MKNEIKKTVATPKDSQTQKQAATDGQKVSGGAKKLVGMKPAQKVAVTLTQLAAGYAKKKLAYDKLRAALEKRLESLKKGIDRFQVLMAAVETKLANMVPPNGATALIIPLGRELLSMFPGFQFEVSSPMGLSEAVTLTFFPKDATAEDRVTGKGCKSLTICTKMPQGGIGVRDYSKDTKTYAPGSIGYSSGLNHPTVQVPQDASVSWFAQYVK